MYAFFSLGQTKQFVIHVCPYRWEKCDVILPWYQNFCIKKSFLTERAICIVERLKKSMGYTALFLSAIVQCQFFLLSFFLPYL